MDIIMDVGYLGLSLSCKLTPPPPLAIFVQI